MAGAGVDLGRLDDAMLAFGAAGPALSDSFGAVDPALPDADREAVEAAMHDVGAVFKEPHKATLTVAYRDPARRSTIPARAPGRRLPRRGAAR